MAHVDPRARRRHILVDIQVLAPLSLRASRTQGLSKALRLRQAFVTGAANPLPSSTGKQPAAMQPGTLPTGTKRRSSAPHTSSSAKTAMASFTLMFRCHPRLSQSGSALNIDQKLSLGPVSGQTTSRRSLPDELSKSETGPTRSEVIPIMATAPAAPNNTRTPREVVEFPPNVPVTVALKYGHAKTVSSQYGERFMFSLADGRVMFLAPDVGGKIESLGINVCENFTITRKWDEQPGSPITWEVARLAGEQPNLTAPS